MPPAPHHPCRNDQCMSHTWVEDHGVFASQTPMWTNARKRIVKKRNEGDFASLCGPNIIISGFKAVHAISRVDFFMGCQCCAMYHSDRSRFERTRVSWTARDQEAKNQSIEPSIVVGRPAPFSQDSRYQLASRVTQIYQCGPVPHFSQPSYPYGEQFGFGWPLLLLRVTFTISVRGINQSYSRFHLGSYHHIKMTFYSFMLKGVDS